MCSRVPAGASIAGNAALMASGSINMASNKVAVLFNEPICIELNPPEQPGRPQFPTHEAIQNLLRDIKDDGFDIRAVVVLGGKYPYYNKEPKNWGVVVDLKTWHRAGDVNPYKPIGVKWVGIAGETQYFWPEELLLLHGAVSERFVTILTEQANE